MNEKTFDLIKEMSAPDLPKEPVQPYAVRSYPDPMLDQKALPWIAGVTDARFQDLVAGIEATLTSNGALGISGPEVGIPYRLICIRTKDGPLAMVNPMIEATFGELSAPTSEGCLSFMGLDVKVKRYLKLKVTFTDRKGVLQTALVFQGDEARTIQHEMDHLEGIVFVDRIPKFQRSDAMRRYRMIPRLVKQHVRAMRSRKKQLREIQNAPVLPGADVDKSLAGQGPQSVESTT
jgi:peptide deformylase